MRRLLHAGGLSFSRKLEWYPPFCFMGVKITHSADYRELTLKIPLRWYGTNHNGVLFGGFMLMASDPFPALLFEKVIPGVRAWSKAHGIVYLRPARTDVEMKVTISDDDLDSISTQLKEKGWGERSFSYAFTDQRGREVARVQSTAYLKGRKKRVAAPLA